MFDGIMWTEHEKNELKRLAASGKTMPEICSELGRGENAIRSKMKRMHITPHYKRRKWTEAEEQDFIEAWYDDTISNNKLVKIFNRSWPALQQKAVKLSLGGREYNHAYLSVQDICEGLGVSDDVVYRWIKKGLPKHRGGSKRRKYVIGLKDLFKYLEVHQDYFNGANVKLDYFYYMPDWLKAKIKADSNRKSSRSDYEWSNSEDRYLISMYKTGLSVDKIAVNLHRTESAVKTHMQILGLNRRTNLYSVKELSLLKENSDKYTLSELAKMMPGRTEAGLMAKCKSLGLPYHLSRKNCKSGKRVKKEV